MVYCKTIKRVLILINSGKEFEWIKIFSFNVYRLSLINQTYLRIYIKYQTYFSIILEQNIKIEA